MPLKQCPVCGSRKITKAPDTMEYETNGKTILIDNIPADKCINCGGVYYDAAADKYIEEQIELWKRSLTTS